MQLTNLQIEELRALKFFNDASGKPSAIGHHHWDGEINYRSLVDAGFARRYARPPKGFGASRFFGVKITQKGRDTIAAAAHK